MSFLFSSDEAESFVEQIFNSPGDEEMYWREKSVRRDSRVSLQDKVENILIIINENLSFIKNDDD